MAMQENIDREINTLPALMKNRSQFSMLIALLRNQFVFSKTVPFICGLIASYTFMEYTVVFLLMDYLMDYWEKDLRIAAIVTNLQDGLSCLFVVVVSLISEAYTGCFTVITFCAAVSIMGLMLLWISAPSMTSEYDMVYVAIILLALGRSARTILYEFLKNQLEEEKVRAKKGSKPAEHENMDIIRTNIWWYTARLVGYITTTGYSVHSFIPEHNFKSAALIMGGTYLLFYFGCVWCSREKLTSESNLRKICRVCRAAIWKLKLRYPTSENWYYWKHDKREGWYKYGEGIRLLPRVPRLCRWLDKAAIVKKEEEAMDCDVQTMKGVLCAVKEVKEVKRLAILMCIGLTFIAYSLLMASGNIFFLVQTSNLKPFVFKAVSDIPFLFMVKSLMREVSLFLWWCMCLLVGEFKKSKVTGNLIFNLRFKRKAATIRIGIGMVCALICCIIAWQVEVHRLSKIENEGILENQDRYISMTTRALIPQFSLLGITEGLADGGLINLFRSIASESMWNFDESFSQLVIGVGKLLTIPFVIIGTNWFKETANTSRLDNYYEMLAILNIVFLGFFIRFAYRYAYKEEYPEDEEVSEHSFEHVDQANSEEAQHVAEDLEMLEGSDDAETVTANQEGLMEAIGDSYQGNDNGIQLVVQTVTELFQ